MSIIRQAVIIKQDHQMSFQHRAKPASRSSMRSKEGKAVAQSINTVVQAPHFLPCGDVRQRSGARQTTTPQIRLDASPGVGLHHPGEGDIQASDCEVVGAEVEEVCCDAAYSLGVALDRLAPLALQLESPKLLGIELVESVLFVLFHGEASPQGDERITHT
ncbi:hypothetical protein VB716_02350 [Synechococcus sp. CCY9201]|uniref:hypothetical protein n=1 Tax=unclassified Synechococcus TaxID=2626047 RepID=UPI002AD4A389|nr:MULTISPECIES: hypothetical protein [unclassified Synechococcus]MEA5473059.1 hypothetical protein [Synechococcus sp. CCY9201]